MAYKLRRAFADEMIAHAREDAPNECCGILAGAGSVIEKLYRTRNMEQSPYRYTIDPRDLVRAYREIDDNEWTVLGIYHSHTGSPAYPSPTDVRLAEFPPGSGEPAYPDALYFVVSVADPQSPVLRAFHIESGDVREEELELVD
jgi:proteasome lid subunit RPN8/RPN11